MANVLAPKYIQDRGDNQTRLATSAATTPSATATLVIVVIIIITTMTWHDGDFVLLGLRILCFATLGFWGHCCATPEKARSRQMQ